jgi:hypothetical protein
LLWIIDVAFIHIDGDIHDNHFDDVSIRTVMKRYIHILYIPQW